MREHGVPDHILLVYDDAERRIESHASVPTDVIVGAAGIVRRFIGDYHEMAGGVTALGVYVITLGR